MAPAMKAMKARAKPTGLTASAAFSKIAEATELKPKNVKAVVVSYMELAASELKKNGKFKLGGVLNMKLKKKPAKAARKGVTSRRLVKKLPYPGELLEFPVEILECSPSISSFLRNVMVFTTVGRLLEARNSK